MTDLRRPLVAGNWKMNGLRADGLARTRALVDKAGKRPPAIDILICPPATLLTTIGRALGGRRGAIALGAQDCAPRTSGAHTGDIAAPMLADAGCRYVILGHSERRGDHRETSALVRAKATAALDSGLTPIVCVGETAAQRRAGKTLAVVRNQLARSLPEAAVARPFVVAYEPVWAIGSGHTPTPAEVGKVHGALRAWLEGRLGERAAAVRLLYGGSVNGANAQALMAVANVDGGLIGGASLKVDEFWSICVATAGNRKTTRRPARKQGGKVKR